MNILIAETKVYGFNLLIFRGIFNFAPTSKKLMKFASVHIFVYIMLCSGASMAGGREEIALPPEFGRIEGAA
jgi:hypothetical protein